MMTGTCMCGAVRFEARDVERTYGICHCEMCRRWTGSSLLEVTVPEANVTWAGAEHIAVRVTSDWGERANCDVCGSPLYYRGTHPEWAGNYDIPLGLFDDPDGFALSKEIYIDHKPTSYAYLGDGHRQLTRAECVAKFPALDGPLKQGETP